jgi:hypothetical protein
MNQLPEEAIINEIQATVAQARLAYQATEFADAEARGEAAKGYLEVLDRAVTDGDKWEEAVDQQVEQMPSGRTSSRGRLAITHPKDGDPHNALLNRVRPFLIELRKERDDLKEWLVQHRN